MSYGLSVARHRNRQTQMRHSPYINGWAAERSTSRASLHLHPRPRLHNHLPHLLFINHNPKKTRRTKPMAAGAVQRASCTARYVLQASCSCCLLARSWRDMRR